MSNFKTHDFIQIHTTRKTKKIKTRKQFFPFWVDKGQRVDPEDQKSILDTMNTKT